MDRRRLTQDRIERGAGGVPATASASGELPHAHTILAVFFVVMVIPGSASIAGLSLNPSRIFLLIAFVPLFLRWVSGRAGPIALGDIFVLFYCFWIWVSLFANHGLGRFHSAGIQFVEMFGGYLVGRTLVRSSKDFEIFVRYLFAVMVFLLPFALIEFATGWSPLRAISEAFLTVAERRENRQPRLGFLERAQGPFAHAILLGLFCSLGIANFFFTYRDAFVKRVVRMGIAMALVFMSLSSAPLISAGLQILMIGWDRIFAFFKTRWVVLIVIGLLIFLPIQTLYPGGFLVFFFETFLLMPQTGYGRLDTLYWGSKSVMSNPFFGVGQNDWVRAYWMGHPTIDNFWLATAVRYGMPTLLFLWAAIAASMIAIFTASGLTADEQRQRRGYVIALTGLLMILVTVSVWGPVSTFVLTYFGAGVWFYNQPNSSELSPAERRRRRSLARTPVDAQTGAVRGSAAAADLKGARPWRAQGRGPDMARPGDDAAAARRSRFRRG